MGQIAAFELIEELGGKCTTAQFKQAALRKYGKKDSIHQQARSLLRRLEYRTYITHDLDTDTWTIIPGTKMVYTRYRARKCWLNPL